MRNPEVMMTAVDFYSHHHKRFSAVEYKVGSIDLKNRGESHCHPSRAGL